MNDPVERPEYGSLSAPPREIIEPRRRPVVPWLLTAAAIAFALGLLANPWFERTVRARLPGASAPAHTAAMTASQARLDALEASRRQPPASNDPTAGSAQMANQIDDVEQRLSDLQAQVAELRVRTEASLGAVTQGAERAQTVLLVTALRRALERGARIDAYESALRARFGQTHPTETAMLLALGRAPVTPEQLARSLDRLSPTIERATMDGGWWEQLKQNLAGVVAVRRAGDLAADPASRLRFASRQLRAGDVEAALRTMSALPLPAQGVAASWLADARRHAAGMQALAAIEVAALTPAPAAQVGTPATTF